MKSHFQLIRKTWVSSINGIQRGQSQFLGSHTKGESPFTVASSRRYLPEPIKRFYLDATVEKSPSGGFEIHLDKKPLKTPSKQTLTIKDESLAAAVAAEWCSQNKIVQPNVMHLTALCNTVQDNPLRKAKTELIDHIISSLDMDTILYRCDDNEKLLAIQKQKWDPIVDWIQNEFRVPLPLATGIIPPVIPLDTVHTLTRFFESHSFEAIQGFVFGADAIKSVILATATVMDRLTPKEAVHLSRLEMEFQAEHWGYVEWHHEVELFDSIARLSAATLFFDSHT